MRTHRPTILRYGVAALSVGAALVLTLLVPWLRQRETFILFFGAVALSAWYGGRGPGLVSCVLAAGVQNYLLTEPFMELSLRIDVLVPMFIFLAVALTISLLTTTLVEAREQAREQKQWLEVTLSSIGDAVVSTDAQGRVTLLNAVAESISGLKAGDAHGQLIGPICSIEEPEKHTALPNPIERVLRDGTTVHVDSGTLLALRDERRIAIEGNAAPIRDSAGEVKGTVFVFRDVTEREDARKKILDYQKRLRAAAAEIFLAEERERHAIADGLHDRVGLSLGLTRIKLGTLRGQFSDPELIKQFDEITLLMKQIIAEIRTLTFELSPPILYEFGLDAALEWLTNNMQTQHQLKCSFTSGGETIPLKQEIYVPLFQAARELLGNVVKHARAKNATVELIKAEREVRVCVQDDGVGFEATTAMLTPEKHLGFGLFSMRERFTLLGGSFAIESRQDKGTRVTLMLPIGA